MTRDGGAVHLLRAGLEDRGTPFLHGGGHVDDLLRGWGLLCGSVRWFHSIVAGNWGVGGR